MFIIQSRPSVYKDVSGQVFTIHVFVQGPRGEKQFPMIFALMTKRRKDDYVNLFEGLKRAFEEEGLRCHPESFMLDYESATWGAIRTCFPDATLTGCGFHWAKCLMGKWKELGLRARAGENNLLCVIYRRTQAMRHLHEHQINRLFDAIKITAQGFPEDHKVHENLGYIESQWIRPAVFPPSTWCQYGIPLRSNNDLEGWHRAFNVRVRNRPTFYLFVQRVYSEMVDTRNTIRSGDFQRRNNSQTIRHNEALATLWRRFHETDGQQPWDLVDGIARIFGYKGGVYTNREE